MTKRNKKILFTGVIVLLPAVAVACRVIEYAYPLKGLGLLRSAIYLGLYTAWGISVRRRIIQAQVRRYLTAITALMIFWFLVRTVKYHFVPAFFPPAVSRYLWYLYYLPIIFIPLLAVFVAMALGKPENYRLPRWTALFYIPAALLFLLVMTNDLHQLVFVFPADATVWESEHYQYSVGYWAVLCCVGICVLTALVTMLLKCRVPRRRTVLLRPVFPVLTIVLYGILYISGAPWLMVIAGDMTAVYCLLLAATLESCIQCGLIQSNSHYRELFDASTVGAQITDENYRVLLSSSTAQPVPKALLRQTAHGPVMLENGMRLLGAPIRGGHVIWTEDVSALASVLEELNDAKESLEDSNNLLRAEYALKAREAHIAEMDRLYDNMQRDTARQICLLSRLIDEFEQSSQEAERKALLGKMIVIGAYLKRRNNLIFFADKTPEVSEQEVSLTFGESLDNLELTGVACGFQSRLTQPVKTTGLMAMYDFFEEITELSLGRMSALTVCVEQDGTGLTVTINTDSFADLSQLAGSGAAAVKDEDGEWQLTLRLGGDEP